MRERQILKAIAVGLLRSRMTVNRDSPKETKGDSGTHSHERREEILSRGTCECIHRHEREKERARDGGDGKTDRRKERDVLMKHVVVE